MENNLENAQLLNEKIITSLFPVMLDYRDAFTTLFSQEQWQYPEFELWCDELFFQIHYLEKVYHRGKPSWEDILNEDCRKIIKFYHETSPDLEIYSYMHKVLTDDTFEDEFSMRDPDFLLSIVVNMYESCVNAILEYKDISLSHLKTIIHFSKKTPKVLYKLELRGF